MSSSSISFSSAGSTSGPNFFSASGSGACPPQAALSASMLSEAVTPQASSSSVLASAVPSASSASAPFGSPFHFGVFTPSVAPLLSGSVASSGPGPFLVRPSYASVVAGTLPRASVFSSGAFNPFSVAVPSGGMLPFSAVAPAAATISNASPEGQAVPSASSTSLGGASFFPAAPQGSVASFPVVVPSAATSTVGTASDAGGSMFPVSPLAFPALQASSFVFGSSSSSGGPVFSPAAPSMPVFLSSPAASAAADAFLREFQSTVPPSPFSFPPFSTTAPAFPPRSSSFVAASGGASPHHRHVPPPARGDVGVAQATAQEAVARSAVAAMAGPNQTALPFTRFSMGLGLSPLASANDTTIPLTSPPRGSAAWRRLIDPTHLLSPVEGRNAFATPAVSTVPPTFSGQRANARTGPAVFSAHPPLRPRADEGAVNVENARGAAVSGGALDSSAAANAFNTFTNPAVMPSAFPRDYADSGSRSQCQPESDSVSRFPLGSQGSGFGFDFVPSAPERWRDHTVNFSTENFATNSRRAPATPPPPVHRPNEPPTGSVFVRARRFRAHAIQACADLNRPALVGQINDLCTAVDGEVQERLSSVHPEGFEQEWRQVGLDLSASLAEATGATPSAVADSLNASGGDPSVSLLDLLHSKGNSFIESCAAEASAALQASRQSRSFTRYMGTFFPGIEPYSGEAIQALRDNGITPQALYRILGHEYRPGSAQPPPLRNQVHSRDADARAGDDQDFDQDGDEEEEDYEGSSGDDGGGVDGDDGDTVVAGKKRKSIKPKESRGSHNEGGGQGLRMIRDPMKWVEGTAPSGGFELETFQAVYDDWLSVVSGLEKGCGCTFKSRIDAKLIPGIRGNLRMSPEEWDKIDDDALIRKISKKLNFNHSDYYHSQFDVISMPYPPPDPMNVASDATVASDYKTMTNRMLYIIDQARKNNVSFRWTNIKRAYKKSIRGYLRLERLCDRRDFECLDDVVSYTNKKLKKRITLDHQKQHEADVLARAAGVRSDIGGGKSEPSEATPPRGRGGRGQPRGRGRGFGGRGGLSDRSGILKKDFGSSKGSKDDAGAKRLSQAYAKEDALPRGRYWHKRTPFCPAEGACSAKFCQGCGYHGTPGNWHDRPKCRTCNHLEFVKEGYFHEKHPDKLNLFTDKSASLRMMMGETQAVATPSSPAHLRGVSGGADGGSCQHCHPSSGNRSHTS
jgi:hypothetical protein